MEIKKIVSAFELIEFISQDIRKSVIRKLAYECLTSVPFKLINNEHYCAMLVSIEDEKEVKRHLQYNTIYTVIEQVEALYGNWKISIDDYIMIRFIFDKITYDCRIPIYKIRHLLCK